MPDKDEIDESVLGLSILNHLEGDADFKWSVIETNSREIYIKIEYDDLDSIST